MSSEPPTDRELVNRLADGEDPWVIDPVNGCTNPLTGYFPIREVSEEVANRIHQGRFPWLEGEHLVLGPQTFTDRARTVISHRGENYYIRESREPSEEEFRSRQADAETFEGVMNQLRAAKEHLHWRSVVKRSAIAGVMENIVDAALKIGYVYRGMLMRGEDR